MTEEPKRPRGRPRMPDGTTKGSTFSVRFSAAEREVVEAAARQAGAQSASDWAREVLLAAARMS